MRPLLLLLLLVVGCGSSREFAAWNAYHDRLAQLYPASPVVVVVSRDSADAAWDRASSYVHRHADGPILSMTPTHISSDHPAGDDFRVPKQAYSVLRSDRRDSVAIEVRVTERRRGMYPNGEVTIVSGTDPREERYLGHYIRTGELFVEQTTPIAPH